METETKTTARHLAAVPDTAPGRCATHPAYDADYCPSCGTARVIGDNL